MHGINNLLHLVAAINCRYDTITQLTGENFNMFKFSDVGFADAPSRILVGAHLDVLKLWEPAKEKSLSFMELGKRLDKTLERPLLPAEPLQLHRPDSNYSPVERAIRLGLEPKTITESV